MREAFGSEATVLDPAPDELEVAAAAGMETIAGFAEDYDPGDRRWDLVLLCQTIDHLLDVRGDARVDAPHDRRGRPRVRRRARPADRRAEEGHGEGAAKIDHPYYLTHDTALAFFAAPGYEPVAERLSADGHWGFLLRPAEPREPDWDELSRGARRR